MVANTISVVISKDRHEEALKILSTLHADRGEDYIQRELLEIKEQLSLEQAQRSSSS